MRMDINPIELELFQNRFSSIADEMGVSLMRTAFSPNIKERHDFSCALFDLQGDMIAQAAHIPVHLGSMPLSVKSVIEKSSWQVDDMVMLNDPYEGGTHLPDITMVAPVFAGASKPSFYVANRAHHADVGGIQPGSMPLSTSLYQEGLVIPPLKIVEGGHIDKKILEFFLRNVRTPLERKGDISAQIMANKIGIHRMGELIDQYSIKKVSFYSRRLLDYGEHFMKEAIQKIPDGTYTFEDFLEDDGLGDEDIPIRVTIRIDGDQAEIDFSHSASQVKGGMNAVYPITLSAVLYVFRCLIHGEAPTNAGCERPIQVITDKGTLLDAAFPAAVAGGNVETSQRIVDTVLGALAKAMPEMIPAASQGTMNNVSIGGYDPRTNLPFAYYETIGGGMGASAHGEGESGVHSHMTNTLNTPIEALEYAYPMLVVEYGIRRGTGGQGRHRGGDGMIREFELLSDAEVTVISERRRRPPFGLYGGSPGKVGRNTIIDRKGAEIKGGKFSTPLRKGDRLRIETPGGGGYGMPEDTP